MGNFLEKIVAHICKYRKEETSLRTLRKLIDLWSSKSDDITALLQDIKV